jgi:uncharacterized RDD family membrane protein YckC
VGVREAPTKGNAVSQEPSTGGTSPDPESSSSQGGGGQPGPASAGVGVRIGARLIDHILVAIVSIAIAAVLITFNSIVSGVITSLLGFGYFVWLESSQGATLGKKLLNIRVVGPDGGNPAVDVTAKRNVWMLLGVIPLVGGPLALVAVIVLIVTIAQNPHNRGYHDTFAGTSVLA